MDCKDIENGNSMLFFFESPAPKTGSWAQQNTTVVAYDNQIYCVHYIRMSSNDLSNNYSLLFFFQYLLWRSSFVGLQTGRKNTHTHRHSSYRFLLKKEKVMGTRRWTQRAGLDVARWCVVSASMGCVSDTELCTDKSEESHYPFTFISPFWKNYTHNLFLLIIMNVYNH